MQQRYMHQVKDNWGKVVYQSEKVENAERFMTRKIHEGVGSMYNFDSKPLRKDNERKGKRYGL